MSNVTLNIKLNTKALETALDRIAKAGRDSTEPLRTGSDKSQKSFNRLTGSAQQLQGQLRGLSFASAAFAAAITGVGLLAAREFAQFETALVGVGKTTDVTGKELEDFGKDVQELARDLPVATNELLGIAQAAGQLGVRGSANLQKFVDTIARLGVASDLGGEEAAFFLTRILNVSRDGIEDVDRLASTIVKLGNNFNDTERNIARAAQEIGRSTVQFNLSSAEIAGLATATRTFGARFEGAGTAVGRAFRRIEGAIQKGGNEIKEFARISGTSVKDIEQLFAEDATGAFVLFLETLNKLPSSGANQFLRDFKLAGEEDIKVLTPLAANIDKVRGALSLATKEFSTNTELIRESQAAFDTLASEVQTTRNVFAELGSTFGAELAGPLTALLKNVQDLTSFFIGLSPVTKQIILGLGALVAGVAALASVLAVGGAALIGLFLFKAALIEVGIASSFALGPIGLVITAIAALGVSVAITRSETEKLQDSFKNSSTADLNNQITTLSFTLRNLKDRQKELNDENASGLLSGQVRRAQESEEITRTVKKIAALREEIQARKNLKAESEPSQRQQQADIRNGADPRIEQEKATSRQLLDINAEFFAAQAAQKEEQRILDAVLSNEDDEQRLTNLKLFFIGREQAAIESQVRELENAGKTEKAKELIRQASLNAEKKAIDADKQLKNAQIANEASFTAQLRAAGSTRIKSLQGVAKVLFEFQKGVAIASAVMNAEDAAVKAFNFGSTISPFLGPVFKAASLVSTGLNIANISQQRFPSFADGGVVPGNSFSGDKVGANVNSGEVILNRQQQAQTLLAVANGAGESGGGKEIVVHTSVQVDGETIAKAVSRQVADGFELGENI